MTDMNLGLVDLAAALLIAAAVIVRLKRGGGLLSALGSGLATAVLVWIATVAVATWAPPPAEAYAANSFILHTVPVPHHAITQAEQLLGLGHTERTPR